MRNAEHAGLRITKPEIQFEEMLNAIRESLTDHASSNDGEEGEDKDDVEHNPELGKPSEDDEPGWLMGTISGTGQHRMERFQQKQMNPNEMTQPGWGDAAD